VLVIHENRGLTDHIRSVAGRFAASGYSALAIDLLSEGAARGPGGALQAAAGTLRPRHEGGVTELRHPPAGHGRLRDRLLLRRRRGVAAARGARAAPRRRGAVLRALPRGRRPEPRAAGAVLAVYGGRDDRVLAIREAAAAALKAADLRHELLTFTEADHAFLNDTGNRFNPPAAEEAWRRVIGRFDQAVDEG
jgi:carboxymethylenebutenolidase